MEEFVELWRENGRLIRALITSHAGKLWHADHLSMPAHAWRAVEAIAESRVRRALPGKHVLTERPGVRRYLAAVEELARRWGLKAAWASPRLHVAMTEPYLYAYRGWCPLRRPTLTGIPWSVSYWSSTRTITVVVEPDEHETWQAVAARLLDFARPQWESIRAEMEQNPEWVKVDTRPELDKHLLWLYERICPQDNGQPWGWRKIAREASASHLTVRNAVLPLAKTLCIELPALRGGRPRS
ncbi:MAG: hypothetical protein WBD55_10720 [Dehalococcoidia bacterium]